MKDAILKDLSKRVTPLDKDQLEYYKNVGSKELDKFHPIPRFYPYEINKRGIVRNSKTGRRLIASINSRGDHLYHLRPDNINRKKGLRHRLLMYTFKPHPNQDNLEVDHINGKPGDDRLDNLEWVTRAENIKRYFTNFFTGRSPVLNPKIIVKYFDFDKPENTKEVTYTYKVDLVKDLNISYKELNKRLQHKFGTLYDDNTMMKYENDERAFPIVKDHEVYKLTQRFPNPCIGYNHFTKEIKRFSTQAECCKFLGVGISALIFKLDHYKNKIFKNGWEIRRVGEPLNWSKPSKYELERIRSGKITTKPIEAIRDDKRLVFQSGSEAAKYFGYTPGGLLSAMKYSAGRPNRKNGWIFKFIKQSN